MILEDDRWKDDLLYMSEIPFCIEEYKRSWLREHPSVFIYDSNKEVYINLLHRDNRHRVNESKHTSDNTR